MKIYYVKRTDVWDYDEYDSAVVVAKSPKDAKEICKGFFPTAVAEVTLIGTANKRIKRGSVIESFNAG